MWECKSCGAIDSRACNGDNSICLECGTPDDFKYLDDEEDNYRRSRYPDLQADEDNQELHF